MGQYSLQSSVDEWQRGLAGNAVGDATRRRSEVRKSRTTTELGTIYFRRGYEILK
jgi:hypothetical protein